jgi:hypothetical protein
VEDLAQPGVGVDDGPVATELEHPRRERFREPPEQLLAPAQRLVRGHLVGDVADVRDDVDLVGLLGTVVNVLDLEPPPSAVRAPMAKPDSLGAAPSQQLHPRAECSLLIIRMDELARARPDQLLGRPPKHPGHLVIDRRDDGGHVLVHRRLPLSRRHHEGARQCLRPRSRRLAIGRHRGEPRPVALSRIDHRQRQPLLGIARRMHRCHRDAVLPRPLPRRDDADPVCRHDDVEQRGPLRRNAERAMLPERERLRDGNTTAIVRRRRDDRVRMRGQ